MRIYRDRLLDNIIIMLLNRVMKAWIYSFSCYMNGILSEVVCFEENSAWGLKQYGLIDIEPCSGSLAVAG